jgi:ferredoxin
MQAGPRARRGYDLAITELDEGGHRFVVEAATEIGHDVIAGLLAERASTADIALAESTVAATAASITRTMPGGIAATLRGAQASPLWESIADRCLSCGNCTMACPTCFCTTTEDRNDLAGEESERAQRWASCFEIDYSYLHGGSVRVSGESRYRQWMTHKLSTWYDQFGQSGCVGCGRCIVACPVGIDITVEAARFAASTPPAGAHHDGH